VLQLTTAGSCHWCFVTTNPSPAASHLEKTPVRSYFITSAYCQAPHYIAVAISKLQLPQLSSTSRRMSAQKSCTQPKKGME
jgi:hypothetical protein